MERLKDSCLLRSEPGSTVTAGASVTVLDKATVLHLPWSQVRSRLKPLSFPARLQSSLSGKTQEPWMTRGTLLALARKRIPRRRKRRRRRKRTRKRRAKMMARSKGELQLPTSWTHANEKPRKIWKERQHREESPVTAALTMGRLIRQPRPVLIIFFSPSTQPQMTLILNQWGSQEAVIG